MKEIDIPENICWAALAEAEGLVLAVEWVRGNPPPTWRENVAILKWMRERAREDLNEVFGNAYRVEIGIGYQWVCFSPPNDRMWTVCGRETMH